MHPNTAKTSAMIKSGRLTKGLTQLELAELCNISLRSIQRIEKGEVSPRAYTLKVISQQLNIELELMDTAQIPNTDLPTVIGLSNQSARTVKIIWSFGMGLIMVLLSAAFLSQSVYFPETDFEEFLFWIVITVVYLLVLTYMWKATERGQKGDLQKE